MARLTLEERVSRLERLFTESNIGLIEDYLSQLAEIIFKDRELNPNRISVDKHSTIDRDNGNLVLKIDDSIGEWEPYEYADETYLYSVPDDDTYDKLTDIIKSFNDDNNCRIEMYVPRGLSEIRFAVTRLPNEPRSKGDRFSRSDNQWEDPSFQDAQAAARWDKHKIEFPVIH